MVPLEDFAVLSKMFSDSESVCTAPLTRSFLSFWAASVGDPSDRRAESALEV